MAVNKWARKYFVKDMEKFVDGFTYLKNGGGKIQTLTVRLCVRFGDETKPIFKTYLYRPTNSAPSLQKIHIVTKLASSVLIGSRTFRGQGVL